MLTCRSASASVFLLLIAVPGVGVTDQNVVPDPSCSHLVSVAPQPDAPVLVSPIRCSQPCTQSASVSFCVVNRSAQPITHVVVSAKLSYHLAPPHTMSVRVSLRARPLRPGWSIHQFLGGGRGRNPADPLKELTIYVQQVTFADGSRWPEAPKPPQDPRSNSGRGVL